MDVIWEQVGKMWNEKKGGQEGILGIVQILRFCWKVLEWERDADVFST